jgi:hypothetical protein
MMAERFSGTAIFASCDPAAASSLACAGACDYLRHHRRDEQRYAIGALVQRAHERFIGGDRWRTFHHVVADFALGERIEYDLLAQVMQGEARAAAG